MKTETSSEAKSFHGFKYDILCIFAGEMNRERQFSHIVIKKEGDRRDMNSILEEDGQLSLI